MRLIFICSVAVAALGCGGCTKQQPAETSAGAEVKTVSLAMMQKMKPGTRITAHGTMIEKCPVAGCWFILRDQTGTIKVDLKATKQTVVDVPLNSTVTVRGTIAPDGNKKMIRAVSATF